MGYAVYEDRDARDRGVERWAGYGVPGICDLPGCENELPLGRGMGSKCERRYEYDDETDEEVMSDGCGMYFCGEHLQMSCAHEHDGLDGIKPKPDTAEWIAHMLSDDSWSDWRDENPERVAAMRAQDANPRAWRWTCEECGASGPMPDDILALPHDCKSRGPFDEVSRLLVVPVVEPADPSSGGVS